MVIRGFEGGLPFLVTIVNTLLLVALTYKFSTSYFSRSDGNEDSLDSVEENDPAKSIETPPMQDKLNQREEWWER